jgi:hypothetical protein
MLLIVIQVYWFTMISWTDQRRIYLSLISENESKEEDHLHWR